MNRLRIIIFLLLSTVSFARAESPMFREVKNLDALFAVLQELDMAYVDTIDYDQLIPVAVGEMLNQLDPYTVLITKDEMEDFDLSTTGNYSGVGALIHKRDSVIELVEIYDNSPAEKAGLNVGDMILSIDNVSITRKDVGDVSMLLKGQSGSTVSLYVRRLKTGKTETVNVVRSQVHLPSVPYYGMLTDSIGYVSFMSFTKDCSEEVKNAVIQLKKQGAQQLVLDLRSNPGGLLDEAVKIANIFLPKGQEIVRINGRIGKAMVYETESRPVDTEIPLVVLINGGSASSSEVLAGALQDLDRAVIVGQRSYGKGVVQSVRPLPFNQKLKLTTAKYYTPSGRCVQAIDYVHRNESGRGSKIADSLIRKFTTRAGRIIYDASGINPDEEFPKPTASQIAQRLYEHNFFYRYANYFYVRHDSIAPPLKFKMNDADYQNFIDFVAQAGFTYETATYKALRVLMGAARLENYDLDSVTLKTLQDNVKLDAQKDLRRQRSELSELLEEEIVGRYYRRAGRMAVSISHDGEVKRAANLVRNRAKYQALLRP